MAGRGSFQAIPPAEVEHLLALPLMQKWDFAGSEKAAVFRASMDKAWIAIHCALSDGTMFGTLGEPPLAMAVLGEHLICQTKSNDFVYLKHPPEVAEISQELSRLSQVEFEEKLAALEPDEDVEALGLSFVASNTEYVWAYFEDMRAFYQRAAAEGMAVLFSWG